MLKEWHKLMVLEVSILRNDDKSNDDEFWHIFYQNSALLLKFLEGNHVYDASLNIFVPL